MQVSRETKYKERMPIETVENIKQILLDLGIILKEEWVDTEINDFYSLRVNVSGSEVLAANGKGATKEYAQASAYAEFLERLQNELMAAENYDEDTWKYKGFNFTPDEIRISVEELTESSNALVDLLLRTGLDELQEDQDKPISKADVLNSWLVPFLDSQGKFIAVKYYSVRNKRYEYMPQPLTRRLYYSNGMCAGNTPQEALVQGLSEVFERIVNIRIVRERICLPTVPDKYLMKYERLYNVIKQLEKDGRFKIIVKDSSLGGKYPVVALIAIDKQRQTYGIKFGAHPDFEIALERCLSEALQGKKFENFASFSHLIFDSYIDPIARDPEENLLNIAKIGVGQYPIEIFNEKPDYGFVPFPDVIGKSNGELLKFMLESVLSDGYDILIKDASYLGFPAYHVIVPGMSEMYKVNLDISRDAQTCMIIRKVLKNLGKASDEELELLINYIMKKQNSIFENSISTISGIEFRDRFVGIPFEHYFLVGICLYKLGGLYDAASLLKNVAMGCTGFIEEPYIRCIAHYASAVSEGIPEDKISSLLHLFYPADIADEVCYKMRDPERVLEEFYPELKCFNCTECSVADTCYNKTNRQIKWAFKDRQAAAVLPDLGEILNL